MFGGLEGNEGVLIERDRDGINNIYALDKDIWFIVVTNYDSVKKTLL